MAKAIPIQIKESGTELRLALSKAKPYQRARVKMLLLIAGGTTAVVELSRKTKSGTASILTWKKSYNKGGLESLLCDRRGGDKRSDISEQSRHLRRSSLSPGAPSGLITKQSLGQRRAGY